MESLTPPRDSGGRSSRPEFVEFRNRIQRLVESLVGLRNSASEGKSGREQERVEVKLESAAVIVKFFVAELSWDTASELAHHFQSSFGKLDPVFLDAPTGKTIKLARSGEKDGSYRQLYRQENTLVTFEWDPLNAGYSVQIETNLNDFNDHFEVFVTDAARKIFPEKRAKKKAQDLESWYKEFGRDFEKMGCRVLGESALGWKDLAGLAHLRERLERSVFQPLAREQLYQKVALRVMPHPPNVLPRGVLLYGPPGCGKTWSMRVIAGEAGLPVVVLPCEAVLTKWYGESENRLANVFAECRQAGRMILLIDEIDALARHRSESYETTARLVSILLSEMDGLAESNQVLLVGSANNLESVDRAVLDRFDLKIEFPLPDHDQLQAALAYYAMQLSPDEVVEVVQHFGGWNFRQVARFAEEVIRRYVSSLNLSLLEASDPPLPRKEDYLAAVRDFRS